MTNKDIKLQTFAWEGVNKRGARVSGELSGANPAIIQADLRHHGITPLKIKKKQQHFFSTSNKRIRTIDIVMFARHLATIMSAGLPLINGLEIIARGHEKPKMRDLLTSIKNDVSGGITLSKSLTKYPKYFNYLFCNLIKVGEQSGTMDVMLKRIAEHLEKTESLKNKIKKALFYPCAVISIAIIVSFILLIFVVPQFEELFSSYNAQLPAFTRMVLGLSDILKDYWWIVLSGLIIFTWSFTTARKKSTKFSYLIDKFILKIKVIGPLIRKATIARFTRTLSTTLAAGIPIIDALKSSADVLSNRVYKKSIMQMREDVSTGQQLYMSMDTTKLFPNMVVQMIAVGEESGSLEDMLQRVAGYYEEEVDNTIANLNSLMEPLIMVILGVLIGGLVLAMYMPIFKLGSVF